MFTISIAKTIHSEMRPTMSLCKVCQKELSFNDIGAYKKFVNRGATEFLCKSCLAKKLDVPLEMIEEKIKVFKKQGCTLFV